MEVFLLLASRIITKFLLPKEPDDGTNDGIRQKSSARSDDLALLFMVEMRGIEPMSEKKAVRVSPGAECLLNFPWRERTHAHYAAVAS